MWELLPSDCFTGAFRALTFRCLSRAGCTAFELLKQPHLKAPFIVFKLLAQPELADELSKLPECLQDPWTRDLLKHHPTLRGEALLHKLSLLGSTLWKDISGVEARHASIRRILTLASVQTHQQALSELSAEWLFLQHRKRKA